MKPSNSKSNKSSSKMGAEGPKRSVAKRKSPMIVPAVAIRVNGKMYGAKPMTLDEYRSPNRKVVPDLSKPLGGRKTLPLPKTNNKGPKLVPMRGSSTRRNTAKKSK